jgi:hypothetical protein
MADSNINLSSIVAIAGALGVISGAYIKIRKIFADREKHQHLQRALILQEAKEADAQLKAGIEARREVLYQEITSRIKAVETRIDNVEEAVNKEISHIRDSYNSEIRFLGSKIEELKDEVRTSLSQVVILVSKLIDKN